MNDLQPCPFCGEPAESDSQQAYRAITDGKIGYSASVYCTHCPAQISFCYADQPEMCKEDVMALVIEWWNERKPDSAAAPHE